MKIPFMDLYAGFKPYKQRIMEKLEELIDSTSFIGGEEVSQFEEEFAQYCETKFSVGCGNGTDALIAALNVLNIGHGDTVLVPANTFIATSEAVSYTGAEVDFVDVEPDYWTIDPAKVEEYILDNPSKKVAAVIPVHLYGHMADMEALTKLAQKYNFLLIEDSAQAHGSQIHGKGPGHWGEIATFSFYPGKNLGAFGDAGGMATNNENHKKNLKAFINHGRFPGEKYTHSTEGVNFRLDTIQAAVLRIKLEHLKEATQKKQRAAERYTALLKDIPQIKLPCIKGDYNHVFYVFAIHGENRDELQKFLKSKDISTVIHYPIPLHLQPAYKDKNYSEGSFHQSEYNTSHCLSIPLWPEISQEEQEYVAEAIKEFYY